LALVLIASLPLGCSRVTNRATSLFEPLESADVLGFFWASTTQGIKDLLPGKEMTDSPAAMPQMLLVPDATALGMIGTAGLDASRPATIAFVDPQMYASSIAYVLPMTSEAQFLSVWRGLPGMQEVEGEALHFFANRRSMKLSAGGLLGLPQAEVKRHDYFLRFRDGFAFVLPSKDAEGTVGRLLERFNLRAANSEISEFLSVDVDRLISANEDTMQVLRELTSRLDSGGLGRGPDASPLAAYAALAGDASKWALERVRDIDHFWFARSGTTFSSRLKLKSGSALRDDLRLLGGTLDAPFSRAPAGASTGFDLALDPVRLGRLVGWLQEKLPREGGAAKVPGELGGIKRIQVFGVGSGTGDGDAAAKGVVGLLEAADEKAALALIHGLAPDTASRALDRPLEVHQRLPGVEASEATFWCVVQGPWIGVQLEGKGELLQRALAPQGGSGSLGAKVPASLLTGACAVVYAERRGAASTDPPYVARLGWANDELLIDGREIEAP
jgi:hypothetical protein